MNIKKPSKNAFNKLIEKAYKGSNVSTKELHREFDNNDYKNFKALNLTLEDLKMIVSDIADSKETSTSHIQARSPRVDVEAQY